MFANSPEPFQMARQAGIFATRDNRFLAPNVDTFIERIQIHQALPAFESLSITSILVLGAVALICGIPVVVTLEKGAGFDDIVAALILSGILGFVAFTFVLPKLVELGCTICQF